MSFQPTLSFFTNRMTIQRIRARFPAIEADDDDDVDSPLDESVGELMFHSALQLPLSSGKELRLLSHRNLLAIDTPTSENEVLMMAERFQRYVPNILRMHTRTHWKQFKSTNQLNFAVKQRPQSEILNLNLIDPVSRTTLRPFSLPVTRS
ncbi:hypothetical protein BLNAU_14458 [Blattamonas nauphoetae]|uniref:Uncharacterized protein n=1 Tax=Blattamonas nauphoetae TaxID=2049346 RepID=A0ABQ9XF27_9EUKA|nr:hypothetical protein BLNAU_14458 [Blattamonas nauphoetae]